MLQKSHILLLCTLTVSTLFEIYARYIAPYQFGMDLFGVWPPIDNFMHFLWGVNIFLIFVILVNMRPATAVLGVYAWQMIWEVIEMIGDLVQQQPPHMLDHFFMDGIKDTAMDLAGAYAAWWVLQRIDTIIATKEFARTHQLIRAHLIITTPLVPIGMWQLFVTGTSHDMLAVAWILLAIPVAYLTTRYVQARTKTKVST